MLTDLQVDKLLRFVEKMVKEDERELELIKEIESLEYKLNCLKNELIRGFK